jgi:nucleotide-binding universal stress UspA family protein
MMEKILVTLDGSNLGELSLAYVKELAQAFNSEVCLVHVSEKHDPEYRRTVQEYLEKVGEGLSSDFEKAGSEATVKTIMLDGKPAAEIVLFAQNNESDLVIITSHGHSGIMPWVMGSTANTVIHTIKNPVLLVRASMFKTKRRPVKLFNKILLPLDSSAVGEAALPYVTEIAQKLKSEVILFSVIESGQQVHTIGGQNFIRFSEQQVESMKLETTEYLATTKKNLADNGITVHTIVREGDAAREIIKLSQENNIRLVAMSSHGRSGMRGWVFGSVSNKVLNAGKTSILFVRPPHVDVP